MSTNTSKEAIRSDTVNRKRRPMAARLQAVYVDSVCVLHGLSNHGKHLGGPEGGSVKDAPRGECKLIYGPLPEKGQNTRALRNT